MTFRNYIVEAATQVCEFNSKLAFARVGPAALSEAATMVDIRNQAILVQEEKREYENATSILDMLDGTIDMLVTEVWLDVLEAAFHENSPIYTISEAIEQMLDAYKYKPLTLQCVEPMLFLARLGVNLQGAIQAVIDDNNTKFTTEVHDTAKSVTYYREVLKVNCEARPVDHFSRQWGIFRLPDLKLLKPQSYMARKAESGGLNLLTYIPSNLHRAPAFPLDTIAGASTIHTWANRSIK